MWLLPADAVSSVIFEVVYQPGAGSQPWALQCRCEHEDQISSSYALGSCGRQPPWVRSTVRQARCWQRRRMRKRSSSGSRRCDIGKAELVCCVRVPDEDRPGRRLQEVETYATMTRPLLGLADRLRCLGVTRVVMEATGDYWKPVVRHEAPFDRVGMKGLHRRAVAAACLKLGAA